MMTFSRDAQGKVKDLTVRYQGKVKSYAKISDSPPNTAEPPEPLVAIKLGTKLLDAAVGHYEFAPSAAFPAGAKVRIWQEGDRLVGQALGQNTLQGAFDIYPESKTNFFLKVNGAQLTFLKNDAGQVTAVIYHSYGARFPDCEGKKVSVPAQ